MYDHNCKDCACFCDFLEDFNFSNSQNIQKLKNIFGTFYKIWHIKITEATKNMIFFKNQPILREIIFCCQNKTPPIL